MASLFSPGARAPREYNAPDIQKAFNSYSKALNVMLKDISELNQFARETRLAAGKREASFEIVGTVEFYQFNSGGTEYAAGKVVIKKGWVNAVTHRYRWTVDGGNNEDADSWSSMSFVSSPGRNTPEGGYWLAQEAIPVEETDEARSYSMQIQIQDADGSTWITGSHSFDPDYLPRLRDFSFYVGKWNPATNKWKLHLDYTGDEDTGSIKYALASSPFASDELLDDVDFTTYIDGQRQTGVELAEVDATPFAGPDVSYYIIARARSDNSSAPVAGANGEVIWRREVKIPLGLNDPSVLDNGSVIAQKLEDSLQRADVNLSMSHNGIDPDNKVDYSGSISYADNVVGPYAVSGTIDLSATTGIQHIYFDPSVSTTALQIGTAADAHSISGRRVFVAVMEKASEVGERAFFVHNNEVAITAPYVYAASLSAITANLGTITAGTIEVTATVEWGAVSGTAGAPADGATVGADWASNLTSIPIRFNEDDAPAAAGLYVSPSYMGYWNGVGWKTYMDILGNFALDGPGTDFLTWDGVTGTLTVQGQIALTSGSSIDFSDVTGATKPADNATVGADWTSNLASIPARFGDDTTPSVAGLYLNASYMGFHNGDGTLGGWKTYMDSSGNFYLSGSGSNSLTWNGATLSINGDITATGSISGATVSIGTDVGGAGIDGISIDGNNYWYRNDTGAVVTMAVGNGTNGFTYDSTTGNFAFYGKGTILNNSGAVVVDPAGGGGAGVVQNANMSDLTIAGTLTIDTGTIVSTDGTYTMTIGVNEIDIDYPTTFNVNLGTGGLSVTRLLPTINAASASYGAGAVSLTGVTSLTYISLTGTSGLGQATALYPDNLTSNKDFAFTTSSGGLTVSAAGALTLSGSSVTIQGSAWPSNASGFLQNDGLGGLSWGAAGAETDPVFTASAAAGISGADITNWNAAYGWGNHALVGYLTSFTETDPVFAASAAAGITAANKTEWNSAYSHSLITTGNPHNLDAADVGAMSTSHPANAITGTNITNWNTAYGWGNHASAGYLTSYTETDPVFLASAAAGITGTNITNWNTAYGWGNHASAGYLTSLSIFGGTDDIVITDEFGNLVTSAVDISWVSEGHTAYGWGNHATAGYLTSETSHADVVVDGDFGAQGLMRRGATSGSYSIVTDNSTNWNTAYSWGNHASAGYFFTAGSGLTNVGATVAHADTSALSGTYSGSAGQFLSSITVDSFGHVTSVTFSSVL